MTDTETNLSDTNVAENRAEVGASELSVLLPCPFCGGEPIMTERGIGSRDWRWLIICMPCRNKMTVYRKDKIGVIDVWNRRAG